MRFVLVGLGTLAAALALDVRPSNAEILYPWCAQYSTRGGATNCGFVSWEQCMATVRGIGGFCTHNTFYGAYAREEAPSRKHRRGY